MSTGETKTPGRVFGLGCGTIALVPLCISIALPLAGCALRPTEAPTEVPSTVTRTPTSEPSYTPPAPTYTPTPHLTLPTDTPKAPLAKRSFGPAYKASAVARLEGTAFEISPTNAEYQSLDEDRITWGWNILSTKPGHQTVNACIIVRWQPIEGEWETIERTIWRAPLTIVVEQPWIKTEWGDCGVSRFPTPIVKLS